MLALKVKINDAQKVLAMLSAGGMLDHSREIKKSGNFLFVPVNECPKGYKCTKAKLRKRGIKPRNLREALAGMGIDAKGVLSSFEMFGDMAVVEVPEGMNKKKVAKAIMQVHPSVKSIYNKVSAVKGAYRTRKLKLIMGKSKKEAEYRENGVRMMFDPQKVFFSPRLAYERDRISNLVKGRENVLVLFAGAGPFALVISKKCPSCKVIGIELNPTAVRYFKKNITLNKFSNVEAVLGDVAKALSEARYKGWPDRVVMPLPKEGEHFLKDIEKACKKGTVVHFYTFVSSKNPNKEAEEKVWKNFSRPFSIRLIRNVRDYSPDTIQVVVDFEVKA